MVDIGMTGQRLASGQCGGLIIRRSDGADPGHQRRPGLSIMQAEFGIGEATGIDQASGADLEVDIPAAEPGCPGRQRVDSQGESAVAMGFGVGPPTLRGFPRAGRPAVWTLTGYGKPAGQICGGRVAVRCQHLETILQRRDRCEGVGLFDTVTPRDQAVRWRAEDRSEAGR